MQFPVQLIRSLSLGDGTMTSGVIRRVLLSVGVIGAGQWLLSDVVHVPGGGWVLLLLQACGGCPGLQSNPVFVSRHPSKVGSSAASWC